MSGLESLLARIAVDAELSRLVALRNGLRSSAVQRVEIAHLFGVTPVLDEGDRAAFRAVLDYLEKRIGGAG